MKTINIADTLIHVHENLDVSERRKVEEKLRSFPGMIAARFNPGKEHMLSVAFDPKGTHGIDLLQSVRKLGYHAKLIGL